MRVNTFRHNLRLFLLRHLSSRSCFQQNVLILKWYFKTVQLLFRLFWDVLFSEQGCSIPLAGLNINRQEPHPLTSPACCPVLSDYIRAKDDSCGLTTQHDQSVQTFECLGSEFWPRAEPWVCHGNLWTWWWTQPKTIDHIQTNMIPAPCSLFFVFSVLPPSHSTCTFCVPSRVFEHQGLYYSHVFFYLLSRLLFNTSSHPHLR